MNLHDEAWDRRVDAGLAELCGNERAPDVTARVLARLARGEVVADAPTSAPTTRRRAWLAAALLLLGLAAVVGTFVLQRHGDAVPAIDDLPRPPGPPPQDPQEPVQRNVVGPTVDNEGLLRIVEEQGRTVTALQVTGPRALTRDVLRAIARCRRLVDLQFVDCTLDESLATGEPGQFGRLLFQHFPGLRVLGLDACRDVDDESVAQLLAIWRLERLDLSHCTQLTPAILEQLPRKPSLRLVTFADCEWLTLERAERLLAAGIQVFNPRHDDPAYTHELERLALRYAPRTSMPRYSLVRELGKLEALPPYSQHVALRGLGDEAMHVILDRHEPLGLQVLAEKGRPQLTDHGLQLAGNLRTLTELELEGQSQLTARGFAELAHLQNQQVLRLTDVPIDDDGLQVVARLPALQTLALVRCRAFGARGAETIAACRALRSLTVRECDLGPDAIAQFGAAIGLESLDLWGLSRCNDRALMGLQRLTRLRTLALGGGAFTSMGLQALAEMQSLASLRISGSDELVPSALDLVPTSVRELMLDRCSAMDAEVVPRLRERFPHLAVLSLADNAWVDDRVVAGVLALPELESLSIAGCRNTSAASLPAIRAAKALRQLDVARVAWFTPEIGARLAADLPLLRTSSR